MKFECWKQIMLSSECEIKECEIRFDAENETTRSISEARTKEGTLVSMFFHDVDNQENGSAVFVFINGQCVHEAQITGGATWNNQD